MAGEKFKLNFVTNGEGIKIIDEPSGFDAADFTLKQESKRYGRDVAFAGGESEFSFYQNNNHYFELLVYYYETFGWESEVQLIVEIDGFDNIIGDFDFFTAKTDLLEYFSCKVVQNKKQALIKKRNDIKIDLFASEDLDGNEVTPITTENLLVKAKPIKQNSRWETPETFERTLNADSSLGTDTEYYAFNPAQKLVKYEINDSYVNFDTVIGYDQAASINNALNENFILLTAQDNLSNIKINISEFDFLLEPYIFGSGNGYVDYSFVLKYGTTWATATQEVFFSGVNQENEDYSNNSNFTVNIPALNRGDSVWLYFFYKIRQSASTGGDFRVDTTINSMVVEATATATSYNTIAPSVRLYDATYQTVKKISQLDISFPFAEPNGGMYNQRLLNGNLLRNISDRPFYLSMKDITEWLPEINGDYEVGEESVFFGKYPDFYRNVECGYFETVKFDDYEKTFNERYAINQFNYKYKKYQSQKENEIENTYDVVHGESEWLVQNVFVENKKEISISFVRDAFIIAEMQKKALTTSEDTATQDDDTIFIIDTIESTEDYVFQETDFLQHIYDTTNSRLELNNTGNFSFVLLGITVGTQFRILGGDTNAGTYTVYEVTNRKLMLSGGTPSVNNNGERNTQFEYVVTKEHAPYKTWGNEGFDIIDGLANTEDYANLKYSLKRNVVRFYNEYLATANLYAKKAIKNTFYKNNPDAILSYNSLETVEGDSFTPTSPLLNPYKHNITLITDFATYKTLENRIREDRGFIRIWDREGFFLKVFPQEMIFVNSAELGELTIIGEEKYETSLINISYSEIGYLIINDYYRTNKIIFEKKDEKFYIFDEMGRLLFKPTYWHKITVNNINATSELQLIEWLTLIS